MKKLLISPLLTGVREMLPIVSAVVVALAAALAIRVVTRPDSFSVQRSRRIEAPPERIYALLQDFREWRRWSPWEHLDPAMQRTFSGAAEGMGSAYAWAGNSKAGEGRMEIVAADPPRHLGLDISFLKPFRSENRIDFALTPRGEGTEVTWSMQGPNSLQSKVLQSFVNMDRLMGRDFERGLQNLKDEAEQTTPRGSGAAS